MKNLFTLFVLLLATVRVLAGSPGFQEVGGTQVHCPGDVVTYRVYTNDQVCAQMDVNVTGGKILSYSTTSGESYRVSDHEVRYYFTVVDDRYHYVGDENIVVQWDNPQSTDSFIEATGYYHYYQDCTFCPSYSNDERLYPQLGIHSPYSTAPSFANCIGSSTSLSVEPQPKVTSYTWYSYVAGMTFGGASQVTTTVPEISVTTDASVQPGNYLVYVVANPDNGCTSKPGTYLQVSVSNSAIAQPDNTGIQLIQGGSPCYPFYDVRAAVVDGAEYYEATTSNGYSAGGTVEYGSNTVYYALNIPGSDAGSFTVTVHAWNGCSDVYYTSPTMGGDAVDPSCSARKDDPSAKSSTSKTAASKAATANVLTAYPNPVNNQLNLVNNGNATQVMLYDITGKRVVDHHLAEDEVTSTIDVTKLPEGIYLLQMQQNGKVVFNKRLTVAH